MYQVVFGLLTLLLIVQLFAANKWSRVVLLLGVILIQLFVGLRGNVGDDDEAYRDIYESYESSEVLREPIFSGLIFVLRSFTLHSQALFLSLALINGYLVFQIAKSLPLKYSTLFLIIYFSHRILYNDMNMMRQGTASLLFGYSLFFHDRNRMKFHLINLMAAGIHAVSIGPYFMFVVAKRLAGLRYLAKRKLNLAIILPVVAYLIGVNLDLSFLDFFESGFYAKVNTYLIRSDFNSALHVWSDIVFYKMIFLLIFIWIMARSAGKVDRNLVLVLWLSIICLLILQSNVSIAKRVASFMYIVEPTIIVSLIALIREKWKGVFLMLVVLMSYVQLFINISIKESIGVYNTFWTI